MCKDKGALESVFSIDCEVRGGVRRGEDEMKKLSEAQAQVLVTVLEVNRRSRGRKAPDLKLLHSSAQGIFEEELLDWSGLPERLLATGLLEEDKGTLRVSKPGLSQALDAYRDYFSRHFDDHLVRCVQSPTYSRYCERVYGRDLCQFNDCAIEQIDQLLEALDLSPSDRVLDLGCGAGRISEYISDETGAKVTGLDYAPGAIDLARKRTEAKHDRLAYQLGNLDRLELIKDPFDAVVAIDVLYFAVFITKTMSEIQRLISPHGQLGALFTQMIPPGVDRSRLLPGNTVLAEELTRQGMPYTTLEFTSLDLELWERSLDTANELREAFEAEGNGDVFEARADEASRMIEMMKDNRLSSFLYHVRL
jgi:SAM-dependent methyltransferase